MDDKVVNDERPRLGLAAVALSLALVIGVLALTSNRVPEPRSAAVPRTSFSATRAMEHVAVLAREPRPTGVAAHDAARAYLVGALEGLGLEVEVQETTWVRHLGSGRHVAARVRNILGRQPGHDAGGGTLLLMAHYDTQPQTYGAGDDAAGVAVILETLRAIGAGPSLDNEIVVAFTDAEEQGLLGAEAFVADHPWFERIDRTLNFEGRGRTGAAIMFETAPGGLAGVRDLARHAPLPVANSTSYEVYRRMPNDTDFSVIRRASGHGLNFSFIGGLSAYHSRLDTAGRLDPATLEHMGSNALALVRHYGMTDLAPPSEAEGVYFNPLGPRSLWVFGRETARTAAALSLVMALATVLALRRGGRLLASSLSWGLGLFLAAAGGAMALGWAAWFLLERSAPPTPHGVPYAEGPVAVALGLVALAAWLYCQSLWRRSPWELLAALGVLWSVLGGVVSWWLLGASHLFVVPGFFLALGTLLGAVRRNPWWPAIVSIPPGMLLWVPTLQTAHLALTVHAAAGLALLSVLPATLLTPATVALGRRWQRGASMLALGIGVGLVAWAVHGRDPSPERPLVNDLFLFHDRESGETTWRSLDPEVDVWTERVLGAQRTWEPLPAALDPRRTEVLTASAAIRVPDDTLSVVRERDERPGGGRRVAVRLRSQAAASLRLWARAEVALVAASLDGRPCEVGADGELRLSIHGRAADGFLLELELADRWPIALEVVEVQHGLPATTPSRPKHLIAKPGWWTDTTMTRAIFTL